MDPHGHIYMDDEDKIPDEDKARLEGFLRGRAEADASRMKGRARNEPCPCGSGVKFKRCCGSVADAR